MRPRAGHPLQWLEQWYGGLDRMYLKHKRYAVWGMLLLAPHLILHFFFSFDGSPYNAAEVHQSARFVGLGHAYSPHARNGEPVRAGTVLGDVGNSGDAELAPPHLHFEIHPAALLGLGYDGAVDPTSYLRNWRRDSSDRTRDVCRG